MSTKTMRSGDNTRAAAQQTSSKDPKQKVPKQLIERIKEATNATDEVIIHTLEECNYDPNEATTRLIENPFMEFTTKAKRKQQRADSAKDSKVIEVRRSGSSGGSTRGGRGAGRGDRQSADRARSGRGTARATDSAGKPPAESGWGTSASAADGWDEPESAPLSAPSPSRPTTSPAVASTTPLPPHPEPVRPSWGRPGAPGTGTMADLLKRPPPAATAPPPDGQLPPSAPDEKQEIVGSSSASSGQPPQPIQLQESVHTPESTPATAPPDPVTQSLGSLQSGGQSLQTLSSSSMPSSYPNAPQPIGPPSGSVSHSNTQSSSQDQPMHKTSTSDLGGVAVDPPVRPSYQPQQDLHSNGVAQHDAWGQMSSKPSSAGSGPGPNAASQSGLSQQANFGQSSQHQGPQQNLGPSLLSSLNAQSSSGPSTSDALHSLSSLSTPSMSTSNAANEAQGRNSFHQERNQYSMLPQVDSMQMQFGQVQLNGNDFGNSGFGTGFGASSSQSQSQDAGNSLEDMSFLRQQQQHAQQQQHQQPQSQSQQQSQQSSRAGSDAATSTADGLIQQRRPNAGSDFQSSTANRGGYGAFSQSQAQTHAQPATSRAVPAASQAGAASVSAGIQTESSSLGDTAGQGYGSYGSAQGMGGFGNQQSQYSQTPQYQSYGDSSAGTPTAGVAASKQPSYDSYSSYGNTFAQPSFGGQKSDLYSGHASHASQPQVTLPRYGNQQQASGAAQSSGLHAQPAAAAASSLPHATSATLSASSAQSAPQLPQMPYAGPGGLPPSMGQYGNYSQTPPYSYMNPQAAYFNPMGSSSYGGYPQGSSAYPNAASTGFSGNSGYQHGGHPKYQGYGNQGYGGSNGYDDSSSGYGKDRDNMYGNHQHGHGHAPNHARLPQDPYKAYNQYQQPAHGSNYGGPHNQFGGYGQQNQHTPAPYHGANSQAPLNGGGFGRLS